MRHGEAVFCDSGAWIALALSRDPLHQAAVQQWELLQRSGAKLHTSIPVVIETFTFLDRNANRDVAMLWRESIYRPGMIKIAIVGVLPARRFAQTVGRSSIIASPPRASGWLPEGVRRRPDCRRTCCSAGPETETR
jgi:hypothetical protein